jgi:Domain of unknown function (DUF1963)
VNYRFNIDEWLQRFPLEEEYGRFHGNIATSPWDNCQNEQLRHQMQGEFEWGPAVPVDMFVMADGETEDRQVTKIGGLPYRPAAATSPTDTSGKPLVFLAQFNFGDSKDLTGELPGDVLLVFAENYQMPGSLHFEWQRRGLQGLISPAGMLRNPDAFDPCYGHVFRTVSFPQAERRDRSSKYPKSRGKDV